MRPLKEDKQKKIIIYIVIAGLAAALIFSVYFGFLRPKPVTESKTVVVSQEVIETLTQTKGAVSCSSLNNACAVEEGVSGRYTQCAGEYPKCQCKFISCGGIACVRDQYVRTNKCESGKCVYEDYNCYSENKVCKEGICAIENKTEEKKVEEPKPIDQQVPVEPQPTLKTYTDSQCYVEKNKAGYYYSTVDVANCQQHAQENCVSRQYAFKDYKALDNCCMWNCGDRLPTTTNTCSCTDQDTSVTGGYDLWNKGTCKVIETGASETDWCLAKSSGAVLQEYYCKGPTITLKTIDCATYSAECVDGKCVKTINTYTQQQCTSLASQQSYESGKIDIQSLGFDNCPSYASSVCDLLGKSLSDKNCCMWSCKTCQQGCTELGYPSGYTSTSCKSGETPLAGKKCCCTSPETFCQDFCTGTAGDKHGTSTSAGSTIEQCRNYGASQCVSGLHSAHVPSDHPCCCWTCKGE